MEKKTGSVTSIEAFKAEKKRIEADKERLDLGIVDIEGDLNIMKAVLGLPENTTEEELYRIVLQKIEKLRKDRIKRIK